MIVLFILGLGMCCLGVIMVIRPRSFAHGVRAFSRKSWFHQFEITSRLVLGATALLIAEDSQYPRLLFGLGGLLCFVSLLLILIGSRRHIQFAQLSAKIGMGFRPIGIVAIACGATLCYFSLR